MIECMFSACIVSSSFLHIWLELHLSDLVVFSETKTWWVLLDTYPSRMDPQMSIVTIVATAW